jgi:hypothetical protein
MITQDLNYFINSDLSKTPPMKVQVIGQDGVLRYEYTVPANFQLDLYVQYLFPFNEIMVSETNKDLDVSVVNKDGSDLQEIHHGIFQVFPLREYSKITRH